MIDATKTPAKLSRTRLSAGEEPKCRVILPPVPGGWSEPVLFEWELTAESWTDEHPHSEYNFVIEGQLFVESGGVTVEAQAGDGVRVPAGAVGRYWAPKRARMLAIYGPSKGGSSKNLGYERLNCRKSQREGSRRRTAQERPSGPATRSSGKRSSAGRS